MRLHLNRGNEGSREILRNIYYLYRFLIEKSLTGYYMVQNEKFLYVNERLAQIFGYTVDEILQLDTYQTLIHPDDRPKVLEQASLRKAGFDISSVYTLRGLKKNGDVVFVELMASVNLFWGQPILHGNVVDITKSYLAQEALRVSEERYRGIVEDQTDLIIRIGLNGNFTFVNGAVCRYLGRSYDDIIGRPVISFIPLADQRLAIEAIKRLNPQNPSNTVEHRLLMPNGEVRWAQWNQRAITDGSGAIVEYQSVGRDITERKALEDELKRLSLHDSLTGLYNRAYFEAEMVRLDAGRDDPVGVIMCDLDGLKLINDSMGHSAGDDLLREAAILLKRCFRASDVVARIGGDEFAVLLPGSNISATREACKRLRRTIAEYNSRNPDIPLSMSVGYSVRQNADRTLSQALVEADNYMYREKLHSRTSARSAIVKTLLNTLSKRDLIAEDHSERMQHLVMEWSRVWGLSEQTISDLRLLAQFHDIGKVGVPDAILFKPGPLTPEETVVMQRHCEIGYQIALSSPDLAPIADWILKHHEWWNGQGYPLGIKGEDIPLESRILAILDAYDVITSDRPFRKARTHEEAIEELQRCAGTQFDPVLIQQFVKLFEDSSPPAAQRESSPE